jgi:hypothetical protein
MRGFRRKGHATRRTIDSIKRLVTRQVKAQAESPHAAIAGFGDHATTAIQGNSGFYLAAEFEGMRAACARGGCQLQPKKGLG